MLWVRLMKGDKFMLDGYEPDYAIPPMETLKEVLSDRKITLSVLSRLSGLDYYILIDIMEVRTQIDDNIADKLEIALGISSSFWINLECNYQSTLKRLK